jgi:hypothetical protein
MKDNVKFLVWERDKGICQKCGKKLTETINEMEDAIDELNKMVEIPIYKWKHDCWKCKKETDMVSYDFVFLYNHSIGDIKKLDEILLRKYSFVKNIYSKTQRKMVIANTCIHCGSLQGNFFVGKELMDMQYVEDMDKSIDMNILNKLQFEDFPNYEDDEFIHQRKITKGKNILANIHHKDCNRDNNNPDNLVLLCRDCHFKTHSELKKELAIVE